MTKEDISLQDYLKVIRKRRTVVLSVFLLVLLFSAALAFLMTPVYKATAQVYVDPGQSSQLNFQQTPYQYNDTSVYIETQMGILKSQSIAERVIKDLGLYDDEKSSGGLTGSVSKALGFFGVHAEMKGDSGIERDLEREQEFMDNIEVSVVKNSNLIKVSYMAEDPAVAANVVNATVQAFIERNLEMKVAPAKEAMTWLNDKVDEIRGKMSKSAVQLQDFKRDKELIVTGDKQANISLQALSDISSKVLEAEARRYDAEVRYQQVRSAAKDMDRLMGLPAMMGNPVIQGLRAQRSMLVKEMAELSKRYGKKHPQMIGDQEKLDNLDAQINSEIDLVVSSIKSEYEAAQNSEKSLKAALGRQKQEAMAYERSSSEFDLMQQDVESSKNIYDAVLKKFQESNLMGNVNMSNVQFIDRATAPFDPERPKKPLYIAIGMIMGVFMSVGAAFMMEYMDNTFKSPEEIEETLGLPYLGMVPNIPEISGNKPHSSIITVTDPKSAASEAFRSIRGSILLSSGDVTPKAIQICSAMHSEGKSTVATNLACIMAAAGEKVMLVDADMRKPKLHRAFRASNSKGLSSLLTSQDTLADVIRATPIPNLKFISSGPISPNPAELLGSRSMKDAIAQLKQDYDRVIIDCPPYLGLADASMLTPLTDGTVLVVRSGKTARELVRKTSRGLEMIKAKVLGVVLNDQAGDSSEYYYSTNYNYYYSKDKPDKS